MDELVNDERKITRRKIPIRGSQHVCKDKHANMFTSGLQEQIVSVFQSSSNNMRKNVRCTMIGTCTNLEDGGSIRLGLSFFMTEHYFIEKQTKNRQIGNVYNLNFRGGWQVSVFHQASISSMIFGVESRCNRTQRSHSGVKNCVKPQT